jgi:arabinogalactan endo-1,4-beta-galactosidase
MRVNRRALWVAFGLSAILTGSARQVEAQTVSRSWTCWSSSVMAAGPFAASATLDALCRSAVAPASSIRLDQPSAPGTAAAVAAPRPPASLAATVVGRRVFLNWVAAENGDPPSSYVLEAGSSSGRIDLASADTASTVTTLIATEMPAGATFMRVRSRNGRGLSGPSNEVRVVVGNTGDCGGLKALAPSSLQGVVNGDAVTLTWSPPPAGCMPEFYMISAGSVPGSSDVASFSVGNTTTFTAVNVRTGSYYLRVRSYTAAGAGAFSNQTHVSVGADPCRAPDPPDSPAATVFGTTVLLTWSAGSGTPTDFIIETGSAPGLSNLAASNTGSSSTALAASAEPGTYYVRLRARSRCGTSGPSREITVDVPKPTLCASPAHPYVHGTGFQRRSTLAVGGVVADYLARSVWGDHWKGAHLLDVLKENGFASIRVGVTTISAADLSRTAPANWGSLAWKNEYWSSREYAERIVREAAERGIQSTLFLFLSADAAFAGKQKGPPEWEGLSVADTAARLREYTRETAQYFRDKGLKIAAYEIGNEIDFGILDFSTSGRIQVPPGMDVTRNLQWMRDNVWNVEAPLLRAAITGVRDASPDARIGLHIAGLAVGDGNAFPEAFFDAMVEHGVDFDYAGLSQPYAYAPWDLDRVSTECWFQRVAELTDHIGGLGRPVVFSEASYPSDPATTEAQPMQDWPFSPAGQARWVREYLKFVSNQPNVSGFFYFYPDFHPGIDQSLGHSGLFDARDHPMPALGEFRVNLPR